MTETLPEAVPIRSIKLAPHEIEKLLDEMDRASPRAMRQRKHDRIPCRSTGMFVMVDQNGFRSSFFIPLRNISRSGVGFLHRAMIHTGSRCEAKIQTADQRWIELKGSIVRSRYVRTGVYEIGLRFDMEVDVARFQKQEPPTQRGM